MEGITIGFGVIIGLLFFFAMRFICAYEFSSIAAQKGHEKNKYYWYVVLFGICGMLMVVGLPDRKRYEEYGRNSIHQSIKKSDPPVNRTNSDGEQSSLKHTYINPLAPIDGTAKKD